MVFATISSMLMKVMQNIIIVCVIFYFGDDGSPSDFHNDDIEGIHSIMKDTQGYSKGLEL